MKIFPITNYFMFGIFILSAVVQYNDPDPLQWIVIYVLAGIACLLYKRISFDTHFSVFVGFVALIWAVFLIPYVAEVSLNDIFESVQMKTESVEVIREIGGLLIVVIWMVVLAFKSFKNKSEKIGFYYQPYRTNKAKCYMKYYVLLILITIIACKIPVQN